MMKTVFLDMEYGTVLIWWLFMLALATAGVPIATRIFTPIAGRGVAFALPVALVTLIFPIYWVGQVKFGPLAIALGVLVLGGLSLWIAWQSPQIPVLRFVEALVVFSLGFILVLGIRAVDPSIIPAGGEKFLDYGLLNALLRADQLPPEDFWFAGKSIQYYYGGQLISALLAMLTGTSAKYAYNLSLATFYGMLVMAAYGLTGAVTAARGGSYRLAGSLAALFVGLASNLVAPLAALLWVLPESIATDIAEAIAGPTALDATRLLSRESFSYWTSSRVIAGTINEFPLFAWLNGDLHAHMLSTPFLLLLVGVAYTYYRTPAEAVRRHRLLLFGAIPPVAGLIAVINTWSFPTTIGVTWLAIAFAPASPLELLPQSLRKRFSGEVTWRNELLRMGVATGLAALVALVGILWTAPFFLGPATGTGNRTIGLFPD